MKQIILSVIILPILKIGFDKIKQKYNEYSISKLSNEQKVNEIQFYPFLLDNVNLSLLLPIIEYNPSLISLKKLHPAVSIGREYLVNHSILRIQLPWYSHLYYLKLKADPTRLGLLNWIEFCKDKATYEHKFKYKLEQSIIKGNTENNILREENNLLKYSIEETKQSLLDTKNVLSTTKNALSNSEQRVKETEKKLEKLNRKVSNSEEACLRTLRALKEAFEEQNSLVDQWQVLNAENSIIRKELIKVQDQILNSLVEIVGNSQLDITRFDLVLTSFDDIDINKLMLIKQDLSSIIKYCQKYDIDKNEDFPVISVASLESLITIIDEVIENDDSRKKKVITAKNIYECYLNLHTSLKNFFDKRMPEVFENAIKIEENIKVREIKEVEQIEQISRLIRDDIRKKGIKIDKKVNYEISSAVGKVDTEHPTSDVVDIRSVVGDEVEERTGADSSGLNRIL